MRDHLGQMGASKGQIPDNFSLINRLWVVACWLFGNSGKTQRPLFSVHEHSCNMRCSITSRLGSRFKSAIFGTNWWASLYMSEP